MRVGVLFVFPVLLVLVNCQSGSGHSADVKKNDSIAFTDTIENEGAVVVTDSLFEKELFAYLAPRIRGRAYDALGKEISISDEYKYVPIMLHDIRNSTAYRSRPPIGVYRVFFTCEDCPCPPELLLQSAARTQFLNLDKGGLTNQEVLSCVEKFVNLYPDRFNDSDKVQIKRNVKRLVLDDRLNY